MMLADLMSPDHRNLSSPMPRDKNARILSQTPCDLTIIHPKTPAHQQQAAHIAEMRCNDFFQKRVPILTPSPKRRNPVVLYDPDTETNITMMLQQSTPVFANQPASNKLNDSCIGLIGGGNKDDDSK